MPELPEVETVRRSLEACILGRSVTGIDAHSIAMRRPLDPETLRAGLTGETFSSARRKGKYLLLDVGEGSLLIHLGMSGRMQVAQTGTARPAHTHATIMLDNKTEIRLNDPRRFGFIHFLSDGEEATDPSLKRLGIDPLASDLAATLPALYRPRRAPVKNLLLDQRLVAGIGNIYAAEALWRSRIHPLRPGAKVSVNRLRRLSYALQNVLREAISQGGTTIKDFAAPDGSQGYFAVRLDVYGKENRPCPRCDRPLKKITTGGRSTTYCPACQR